MSRRIRDLVAIVLLPLALVPPAWAHRTGGEALAPPLTLLGLPTARPFPVTGAGIAASPTLIPGVPPRSPAPAHPADPGSACRAAIAAAERGAGTPSGLLAAIARVESGRHNPATGRADPWPWTINAEGRPGFFPTKAAAIAAVRVEQAAGVRSIDVGCMQVNLLHHPMAFASLDEAFDPIANVAYGARFLRELHAQTGDWQAATARYHSATPERGSAYQRKVAAVMEDERRIGLNLSGTPTIAASRPPPARPAAFLPPAMPDRARILPLAQHDNATVAGRGLDAYRRAPIGVASRPRGS